MQIGIMMLCRIPIMLENPQYANVTLIYKKGCRRIWGTMGLLAWPRCRGRLWSRLSWGRSCGMCRTAGGSGLASMGSRRAGPAWPTWSPSMSYWPVWWMRERLLMLSRLQQSLWHCFPQYSPAEVGSPWLGQLHSWLGKELAGGLSSESGGEWN